MQTFLTGRPVQSIKGRSKHVGMTLGVDRLNSMTFFQKEVSHWADMNLPPDVDHLQKIQEELDELVAAPTDPAEIADVMLGLLVHASKHGIDVMSAAVAKFEIVKTRTYQKTADGCCRHVKSDALSCSTLEEDKGYE